MFGSFSPNMKGEISLDTNGFFCLFVCLCLLAFLFIFTKNKHTGEFPLLHYFHDLAVSAAQSQHGL